MGRRVHQYIFIDHQGHTAPAKVLLSNIVYNQKIKRQQSTVTESYCASAFFVFHDKFFEKYLPYRTVFLLNLKSAKNTAKNVLPFPFYIEREAYRIRKKSVFSFFYQRESYL